MPGQDKLPQNIHALIGEIGEKQVLLRLYLLTRGTDWNVFHNLGEAGFDLLLLNTVTNERLRIEVKTRQRLYSTGTHQDRVHFFLTDGEYKACDILIGYILDHDGFYIIPKACLKEAHSNENIRWRFTVTLNNSGQPHPGCRQYRGAWQALHPDFAGKQIPGDP
jgi:hypothetical protein